LAGTTILFLPTMKLSLLSLASASIFFASSSTVAFVNQPATFAVGTTSRGSSPSWAVFAKAKAAKGAASHEEDLDLTRKVILEKMGMGGGAKVEDAPAPSPAPAKKEVEAAAKEE
jgi:hypothetical protein